MNKEHWIFKASELLDCNLTEFGYFKVVDNFNTQNAFEGYLCHKSDFRYGSMVIFAVNDRETEPQVVFCTPKLHYPFGRLKDEGRRYHWPSEVSKLLITEKLDGTSVNSWSYNDADGNRFTTFKTRLQPVLKVSKYGDFFGLWSEILISFPELKKIPCVQSGDYSLSFELYGSRNHHLIKYDVPLCTKLLFGINQKNHKIEPSIFFKRYVPDEVILSPTSTLIGNLNSEKLTDIYTKTRDEQEKNLVRISDEEIIGHEGSVFYVFDRNEDAWRMYKNKSKSIEQLHWTSDNIPEEVIFATAQNALEDGQLNLDYLMRLLSEEFTSKILDKNKEHIVVLFDVFKERIEFQNKVLSFAQEYVGDEDKRSILRWISQYFSKNEMAKVYGVLCNHGYLV